VAEFDVVVEKGTKRVFASVVEWPGWCRSGKSEDEALATLAAYAARYAKVASKLGFKPPEGGSSFRVVERMKGNATTDFGAPGMPAKSDAAKVGEKDLARLIAALDAGWLAFDAGVAKARGKTLATGPRGGGRSLDKIVAHVREAELGYLSALGAPKPNSTDLKAERTAVREGVAASARGEYPAKGPRGGVRWKARFMVRRDLWHILDHLWEIEDRAS